MTAPLLTFRQCPTGDRETAWLGNILVGHVTATHWNRSQQAAWACFLPNETAPRPAKDLEAARHALEGRVRNWLDCAKLTTINDKNT